MKSSTRGTISMENPYYKGLGEVMDRISNLPDEIICHIGSFLSAKDAAFAMTLSKRWRNMFTIIPQLHFGYMDEESFTDFAEKQVFALPVNSRINEFSIFWEFEVIKHTHITRCLSRALKHGVVDLELDAIVEDEEDRYSPPLELFISKTVAKLILLCLKIDSLPENAYLPALKSLHLDSVQFPDHCTFDTLLSSSPFLEELVMFGFRQWKWSRTVSSPTLKSLKILHFFEDDDDYDDSEFESISFDTPALAYLEYTDYARKEYPIMNLGSLVEAKLHIRRHESFQPGPIYLFDRLKNVEILSATDETMNLIHDFREAILMFTNLSHLTLVNEESCCWSGLRVLLQKSPKLETLVIKGSLHSDDMSNFEPLCECLLGYSFLLTTRIKVFKITKFKGDTGEISQLKQILENLPCLELLEVNVWAHTKSEEIEIEKALLKIPRASECEIKVKFLENLTKSKL